MIARLGRPLRARHVAGALAVAALAALVAVALSAPRAAPSPERGAFAAAAREAAVALPGASARPPGSADLALWVGGHRVTVLRVQSVLPCVDGRAIADDVALALPRGARIASGGAFSLQSGGCASRVAPSASTAPTAP